MDAERRADWGWHRCGCLMETSGPRGLWGPGVGVGDRQGSLPRLRIPSPRPSDAPTAEGRHKRGRAAAPLSVGPASAPPPPSLRSAAAGAAIMICLVLTIFANLFPAGKQRGRVTGLSWVERGCSRTCHITGPAAYSGVAERTFLAVKPDGVQRRLVGEIVRRFERKGFQLVALKLVQVKSGAGVRRRALSGTGGRGIGRCLGARGGTPSLPRPRRSFCESTTRSCASAPSTTAWSSTWARGR